MNNEMNQTNDNQTPCEQQSTPVNLHVKVQYDSEIRRFVLQSLTFTELERVLRKLYAIPSTLELSIKFLDDEDDWVTFTSDEELSFAASLSASLLRLEVSTVEKPQTTTTVSFQVQPEEPSDATVKGENDEEESNNNDKPWQRRRRGCGRGHGRGCGRRGGRGRGRDENENTVDNEDNESNNNNNNNNNNDDNNDERWNRRGGRRGRGRGRGCGRGRRGGCGRKGGRGGWKNLTPEERKERQIAKLSRKVEFFQERLASEELSAGQRRVMTWKVTKAQQRMNKLQGMEFQHPSETTPICRTEDERQEMLKQAQAKREEARDAIAKKRQNLTICKQAIQAARANKMPREELRTTLLPNLQQAKLEVKLARIELQELNSLVRTLSRKK